jgi:hypothetical protein
MSHNVTLKGVKFSDMTMLGNIVNSVSQGLASLDMDAKSFRTYRGQPTGCDAKIAMSGPHDVGLAKQSDGSYIPVFDPYSMSDCLTAPFGTNKIGAVVQEYALQAAEYEAAQNGFVATRVEGEKGVITLELETAD